MDFNTYKENVKRTAPQLGDSLSDQIHMAMGISTEAGEILDAFKKKLAYKKDLDKTNLREELGDLMWYVANLVSMLDEDFEDILNTNIEKLKARYPNGFDSEKAINRDLEKERKILEKTQ